MRAFVRTTAAGILALATTVAHASDATPPLRGTVISPAPPAADFTLTDQANRVFHMASTRGKVVLLSFLYTHCTDFCPFLALKLRETVRLLGTDASGVVVVPVTTDPARDTPAVLADYSREIGMYDAWHFVTGPLPVVRKVWSDYAIGVDPPAASSGGAATKDFRPSPAPGPGATDSDSSQELQDASFGLSQEDREIVAGRIIARFGGGYEVGHDTPFLLVDRSGRLRAWLNAAATPADIAFDVRSLIAEKPLTR
ncbi:MAG TPA: SCO family protein [Spirochaetia bacterium]|nr:SCO family protein [Spirochaetia bacterium]